MEVGVWGANPETMHGRRHGQAKRLAVFRIANVRRVSRTGMGRVRQAEATRESWGGARSSCREGVQQVRGRLSAVWPAAAWQNATTMHRTALGRPETDFN